MTIPKRSRFSTDSERLAHLKAYGVLLKEVMAPIKSNFDFEEINEKDELQRAKDALRKRVSIAPLHELCETGNSTRFFDGLEYILAQLAKTDDPCSVLKELEASLLPEDIEIGNLEKSQIRGSGYLKRIFTALGPFAKDSEDVALVVFRIFDFYCSEQRLENYLPLDYVVDCSLVALTRSNYSQRAWSLIVRTVSSPGSTPMVAKKLASSNLIAYIDNLPLDDRTEEWCLILAFLNANLPGCLPTELFDRIIDAIDAVPEKTTLLTDLLVSLTASDDAAKIYSLRENLKISSCLSFLLDRSKRRHRNVSEESVVLCCRAVINLNDRAPAARSELIASSQALIELLCEMRDMPECEIRTHCGVLLGTIHSDAPERLHKLSRDYCLESISTMLSIVKNASMNEDSLIKQLTNLVKLYN